MQDPGSLLVRIILIRPLSRPRKEEVMLELLIVTLVFLVVVRVTLNIIEEDRARFQRKERALMDAIAYNPYRRYAKDYYNR